MAQDEKPKDEDSERDAPEAEMNETSDKTSDEQDESAESSDHTEHPKRAVASDDSGAKRGKWASIWRWITTHKKFSIPLAVVLVLAILATIPYTRYALAGLVVRQKFTVTILDSDTNKPVSAATVMLAGKQTASDAQGKATLSVRPGTTTVTVAKKYYQSATQHVTVPILKQKGSVSLHVKATGRQVPITVTDKISKKTIASATITAAGTTAKTDSSGKAVLVLPADKQMVPAQITADGYNQATQPLTVTTQADANNVALTPAGHVYFLSNSANGNIDVVKASLDGTDRQTVLAGTGKEDQRQTALLASRDWHYLALLSKRDGGDYAKLFLIDTTTDKVTTMDEGQATFSLVGWSDHRFVYTVNRPLVNSWQPNTGALKSFDASTGNIAVIDQTGGTGDQNVYTSTQFGTPYILKNEVVYTKNWNSSYNSAGMAQLAGKSAEVHSVHPDGSGNHVVKSYGSPGGAQVGSLFVDTRLYEPQGIYLRFDVDQSIVEYEDGSIKPVANLTDDDFYSNVYPTYLVSPSGNNTFWSEQRDGKNTLFVGDADSENKKQIATLSDYNVYGWFGDQYLLVSKNSSELYIMPVGGGDAIKLTDYYKPALNYAGYGYGYGGL